jgi:hypothetical protein
MSIDLHFPSMIDGKVEPNTPTRPALKKEIIIRNVSWDISDVQDWLGHKDIRNTPIYGKISNKRREMQFQKLSKSKEVVNTLSGI